MSETAKQLLTSNNLQSTVWGKRIILAEIRGHFTDFVKTRVRGWTTCACGVQDPRLLDTNNCGCPWDSALSELGLRFETVVCAWVLSRDQLAGVKFGPPDFLQAAKILIAIEHRADELINEINRGTDNDKS